MANLTVKQAYGSLKHLIGFKLYPLLSEKSGAEFTNRLIPGDENFDFPEWSENAIIKNIPVKVFYRTTPEDSIIAMFSDWSTVPWKHRITRVENKDGDIIWEQE